MFLSDTVKKKTYAKARAKIGATFWVKIRQTEKPSEKEESDSKDLITKNLKNLFRRAC